MRILAPAASTKRTRSEPPSFSVLIPAYNAAGTVGAAIESVLQQTLPPKEVIVCDDGSTDDLETALAPFRDRITVIRKQNGGGASALNAAAGRATGEFVAVLDADDAYLPGRIRALGMLAQQRPDLDILTTDVFYEVAGRRVGRFHSRDNPFPSSEQRAAILERCFIFAPAVRAARLRAIGGWDESLAIAYDWDCWLRLILDGASAGSVDEPLAVYRVHGSSLSARRADSLRERVTMLERTTSHPGLTPHDRAQLQRALARHRSVAVLAEAQHAARLSRGDARTLLLDIARRRSFGRRARLRALVLGLLPAPLRARLLRTLGFGTRMERRAVADETSD